MPKANSCCFKTAVLQMFHGFFKILFSWNGLQWIYITLLMWGKKKLSITTLPPKWNSFFLILNNFSRPISPLKSSMIPTNGSLGPNMDPGAAFKIFKILSKSSFTLSRSKSQSSQPSIQTRVGVFNSLLYPNVAISLWKYATMNLSQ